MYYVEIGTGMRRAVLAKKIRARDEVVIEKEH